MPSNSVITGQLGQRSITVRINDLSYTYQRHRATPVPALGHVSLDIASKEFVVVVGPTGCGKSTLLKVISGLLVPTSGTVTIDAFPLSKALERHRMAVVFQDPTLLEWRTVRKNVQLPNEIIRDGTDSKQRINDLLHLVGLAAFSERYPAELSGGMRQKVALARALNCEPSVLLMDEPFAALDEFTRMKLNDELQQIWIETGVTILFVTHSIIEAIYLADRIVILSDRPARVKAVVEVPFARPRDRGLRYRSEFLNLTQGILGMLEPG